MWKMRKERKGFYCRHMKDKKIILRQLDLSDYRCSRHQQISVLGGNLIGHRSGVVIVQMGRSPVALRF